MKKRNPYARNGYYPENDETDVFENEGARKKRGLLPWVRILMLVVCAAVFVTCAWLLIDYYASVNRAKQATAGLRELYAQSAEPSAEQANATEAAPADTLAETTAELPSATPSPSQDEIAVLAPDLVETDAVAVPSAQPTETPVFSFAAQWPSSYSDNPLLLIADSFQKLRQQNKDIVGWLTIEEVLDEPVLQRDNAFYLTHDSTGAENVTGALFLDENCNLRKLTPNLLIHGHNMKEGAMFGSLKKYKVKDASFYKSHPYITFNTLYEEARYVIFAVAEVNIQPGAHYYLPFWRYLTFDSETELNAYLNMLRTLSHFQTQVDVQPGDRLLTLATCTGDNKDTRLLVVARKLRDDEDSISLNQGILSTQVK